MTTQISIKIGEKSLLAYILKPLTKSSRRLHVDEPGRPAESARPSAESL
jgi:hypothetical protein